MWPALLLSLEKEFRLLRRDRVGLFMLIVAPIVVIMVAGFSLAGLYGSSPTGESSYLLPVVDEDHGAISQTIIDALRHESSVSVELVASRSDAESLVRDKNRAAV